MPSPAASARLKPAAAAVTGTLIRKEKRAASSRLRPKNSPQLIVAPERETPGTRAAACASPIPKAPNEPSLETLSVLEPTASATRNSAPTKMRLMTTTQGERTSVAKKSSKKNPISAPGDGGEEDQVGRAHLGVCEVRVGKSTQQCPSHR